MKVPNQLLRYFTKSGWLKPLVEIKNMGGKSSSDVEVQIPDIILVASGICKHSFENPSVSVFGGYATVIHTFAGFNSICKHSANPLKANLLDE
uniref:Uncharacterized protein n=1 Tax=Romanomermis culicivorax TaxID=13658 RepID=A0A915J629_ROMCU